MRLLLVCLLLIAGCGKSEKEVTNIAIEEVPKAMLEKAKTTLPEVNFDTARKLKNGNIEVRGKEKNGKVREVEFNSAGEVVEIE